VKRRKTILMQLNRQEQRRLSRAPALNVEIDMEKDREERDKFANEINPIYMKVRVNYESEFKSQDDVLPSLKENEARMLRE
jgi:hypothetical protein